MLNKWIGHGRLTKDPELRTTASGTSVASFSVAIDRQFANKETGQRDADFIEVQAWKQQAEFVSKYFQKGSLIIVDGNLRNNNYTDKEGVKHYGMVVVAENISFGGSKNDNQQSQSFNATQPTYQQPPQQQQGYQQAPQQQMYQQQPMYQQQAPQQQNRTSAFLQQAQQQNIPVSNDIGNLSDFESIISDGDTPF